MNDNEKRRAEQVARVAEAQVEAARLKAEREAEEQRRRDEAVNRLIQGPRLI